MTPTKHFREELAKAKGTARGLGASPAATELWSLIDRVERRLANRR